MNNGDIVGLQQTLPGHCKVMTIAGAFVLINDHLAGQEVSVTTVSVADAKAHLSGLVERAAAREGSCITRRGEPIAEITAVKTPRKPLDISDLRALTAALPAQPETARNFIRRIRDQNRY